MYLPVVLSDLNMTTYDINAKYCGPTYDETFLLIAVILTLTNSRLKLVKEEEDFKQTAEKFANELLLEEKLVELIGQID